MTIRLLGLLVGAVLSQAEDVPTPLLSEPLDNYDHHQQIVPGAYALHWKLAGDNIHLAIEATTTGWVAFGLADPVSGSMGGSDIVHAHVSEQGEVVVQDAYAMNKTTPLADTCQDWKGVKGTTTDGKSVVELMRKLDTGDSQDRVFGSDPDTPDAIVVAWGMNPTFGYHQANRFATRLNFKKPNEKNDFVAALKVDSSLVIVDARNAYIITEDVTDYVDASFPPKPKASESACPNGLVAHPTKTFTDPETGQQASCAFTIGFCTADILSCGGSFDGLQQFFTAVGCCVQPTACPAEQVAHPTNTYIDESGDRQNCAQSIAYCTDNIDACGGDFAGLQKFFSAQGCCTNPTEAPTCASFNATCAGNQTRHLDSRACKGEECTADDCCLDEGMVVCKASDRLCKEISANGQVFQCYETGPEDGIPVMFLHGFPEWNKYWFPLQDHWEKEMPNTFHGVACNLRGYSPKAAPDDLADYVYDNFVSDVWALADAVGFDRFHLVGHDHGAGLAWKTAAGSNHTRLFSLTTQSVYHPDAFTEAILNDEKQMVASNYFNQFAMDNNAEALSMLGGGLSPDELQKLLWWYNSSIPSLFPRPEIPSASILTKYPDITLPAMIQQALPLPERPAIPQSEPLGMINVPTFMVCGANDPYLLCASSAALRTEEYVENFYHYDSYNCEHNLFGDCAAGEVERVMGAMTSFLLNFSETNSTGAGGRRLTSAEACPVYSTWKKATCAEEQCSFDGLEEGQKFVLCDEIKSNSDCHTAMEADAGLERYTELCKDVDNQGNSFFLDLPDSGKEYHIIGFEHLITPGLERTVHHLTVHGYDDENKENFLWAWAIGMSALAFPEECGIRVGGSTGVTSMRINYHYDNPTGEHVGTLDTSGIRLYLTEKLRPHDCGVLSLGDPAIRLFNQPLPDGYSSTQFQCPGECTRDLLPNGATVFGQFLHQHQNGKQIWTELYRDGKFVKVLARNDFWDHNFQLTTPVAYKLEAGDELRTTCINHAREGEGLKWGLASDDEMCIDFLYYWPRLFGKSNECGFKRCGSMTDTVVISEGDMEYSFGASPSSCAKPVDTTKRATTSFQSDQSGAPSSRMASVPLVLALLATVVGF